MKHRSVDAVARLATHRIDDVGKKRGARFALPFWRISVSNKTRASWILGFIQDFALTLWPETTVCASFALLIRECKHFRLHSGRSPPFSDEFLYLTLLPLFRCLYFPGRIPSHAVAIRFPDRRARVDVGERGSSCSQRDGDERTEI